MSAQVLDGKAAAAAVKGELRERAAALRARGVVPGLGTLLVGDDPGSKWYVAGKHKDCAEVGIASIQVELPSTATQDEISAAVQRLNDDPACTGFIVQLPLPKGIDTNAILELIDPAKDADGLHPVNLGRLVLNVNEPLESPLPCTPHGIVELLKRNGIDLAGKHVVVLGRGVTVGRPLGLLLTRKDVNATVTLTHTGTVDLPELVRQADVVVAAAGVPGIVTADMVGKQTNGDSTGEIAGQARNDENRQARSDDYGKARNDGSDGKAPILVDVGVSRRIDPDTGKSKVVGDIAPDAIAKSSWYSPNPGGVGPMTRAMLLSNVVEIAERKAAD